MKRIYQHVPSLLRMLLLLVAGQLSSTKAWGQSQTTVQWEQIIESASTINSSISVCASAPSPDGGAMVVVNTDQIKGQPVVPGIASGSMLVKVSSQGTVQWNVSLKESQVPGNVQFYTTLKAKTIEAAVGGGYFVYGTYSGFGGVTGIFLIKINEEGQTIWYKDLIQLQGGSINAFYAGSILALKDGGCLAYNTYIAPRGPLIAIIYRVNAAGEVLFRTGIDAGSSAGLRSTNTITGACEHDGGYELVGAVTSSTVESTPKGWVAKLDQSGQQVWLRLFDNQIFSDIVPTASGDGYVVVERSNDVALNKLALDGTRIAGNRVYVNPRPSTMEGHRLRLDRDGKYLVGVTSTEARTSADIVLFKVGLEGTSFVGVWSQEFNKGTDILNSFNVTADGRYLASGTIQAVSGTSASVPAAKSGYVVKFSVSTPAPVGNLALTPSYNCLTGQLLINATGGNGSAIDYQIIGLRGWEASNSFTVPVYQRNGTSFTLQARQNGQVVNLGFTTSCTTPPTDTGVPNGQFVLRTPDYDCTTGKLTAVYSNGDASPVEYQIIGVRGWGASPDFTVPAWQRTGTSFTVEARTGSGKTATVVFTTACGTTPPIVIPPTDNGVTFATPTLICSDSRLGTQLLINLAGINPDPANGIEYKIPGLGDWQRSNAFAVPSWQANGTTFTLFVRRNGREYTTTFTTNCGAARLANPETPALWQARIMPNPVSDRFVVEVTGAMGQTVSFQLTDISGKPISVQDTQIKTNQHIEPLALPRQSAGIYLLRVSTAKQNQTLKVLAQ